MLQQALRQKRNPPKRIMEAPQFLPGVDFFYYAFKRLSTSRSIGQGVVGAIPYEAISQFCKDEDIVGDDRLDLFYHVEALDSVFIEWQGDKIQSTINQNKPARKVRRK